MLILTNFRLLIDNSCDRLDRISILRTTVYVQEEVYEEEREKTKLLPPVEGVFTGPCRLASRPLDR